MLDVSGVATELSAKLATTAYQEIAAACNLKRDVEKLQKSMTSIRKYLVDAEEKQSKEQCKPKDKQAELQSINEWLQQLKEAIEDASDILDEIEYEALRTQVVKENASFTRKVRRFCSRSNPLAFRIRMSHKIKAIRESVDGIKSYGIQLRLNAIDHHHDNEQSLEQVLSWRQTHSQLSSRMKGRDEEKEHIIGILMRPQSQVNKIDVIPIVGAGGLGKSALAQLVYNDKRVAEHFETLWVWVSYKFEMNKLISDILNVAVKTKIERNPQNSNLEQLKNSLREALGGKRFLLVLDDVWNEDAVRWQQLNDVLLGLSDDGNKEGSKIIVTTRNHRVASVMETIPAYKLELKGLPMTECWELFLKCAFPNGVREEHAALIEIGQEIVRKCNGVPLAVVALGCLLSSKYKTREWKRIKNSELWQLEEAEYNILPALRLSYSELAPQLKQCFSYCSIFPKAYLYNDFHMIPFWMAHGLLQPRNDKEEPEHVGESFINKLLGKSLFQLQYGSGIPEFHELVGNITLTMHDVIHDLALSTMTNERVAVTSDSTSVHENARHLSFWNNVFPTVHHRYPNKVRTINAPQMMPEDEIPTFLSWIFNEFKYLRVLDLAGSWLKSFPDGLGKLKHLRYLRLLHCFFLEELPDSICDLHNLQCLKLERCDSLIKLPENVGRFLVSLRNFSITTQDTNLSYIDVGRFKCLQVLTITDCDNLVSLPRDLWRLTTLKKLFIWRCPELVSFEDEEEKEANQTELTDSLSLQIFEISGMPKLSVLPYWLTRNAGNSLEVLSIQYCQAMACLPEEMINLSKLEHLFIIGCPQLVPRCDKDRGSEWPKIAEIPNIHLQ